MSGGLLAAAPASVPWIATIAAVGACIATLIKAWSVLRKVELDAAGSRRVVEHGAESQMRAELLERIAALEARITHLEGVVAKKDGEIQVLRHDLANESASLDAFILLAESDPGKVLSALPKVKEMRQAKKMRIAAEKGAMAGAAMGDKG